MKTIIEIVSQSPVLQVSIAVFIATVGLFIVSAVQHRLRRLTAIILSAIMVASISAGAIDGTIRAVEKSDRTQMVEIEKEALVALAAGDAREAYTLAAEAAVMHSNRPGAWLTAARAALLLGDLAAADHYYGRLQNLSETELNDWNMGGDAEEIEGWSQLSGLSGSEQRDAAGDFSGTVQQNIEDQADTLPEVEEQADNHSDLMDAEELLLSAQDGDTEVDIDELDEMLEELMDEPGGEDARDILIDSLIWQEDWNSLLEWLADGGAGGLIDIADLVLGGRIPEGELADVLSEDSYEDAVQALADMLWDLRNRAGSDRPLLYLTLGRLYAQLLNDPEQALEMIRQAQKMGTDNSAEGLEILRQLEALRLMLETLDLNQAEDMLTEWLGGEPPEDKDDYAQHTFGPSEEASVEPSVEPTEEALPDELSGENIRTDLMPLFNICAPELTEPGRIRFYVTMAEGSGGFPEGEPEGSDFAFRTNVGFQHELSVNSMTQVDDVERYTMLLIDIRPGMTAEQYDLAQAAALEYVRTMGENEHVLVYKGGIPTNYVNAAYPSGKTELFGNMEMETYLFSSDKAALEAFIMADYNGDLYDGSDIFGMISWALNQMTAISADGVNGDWESFPLASATPRFGQVIVFTSGDADHQMGSGLRSSSYIRGAAIAANAAIHIVGINPVNDAVDLAEVAEAGRGCYIDPSTDSLTAFYNYVRNREVRVFLADCAIPEDPANDFFELWAQHTPTGVMAGFMRNPGRGVDLVGTLHYSDASLSSADFHDYTGGDLSGSGGDPFDTSGGQTGDQTGDQAGGQTGDQSGGGDWYEEVTDWPGMDSLRVDGLDRHSIAKGDSGILLVNLLGQGFSGLEPSNIIIYFPGLGPINPNYMNIVDDGTIQFFLPVWIDSGTYTMQVTIGGQTFTFADTLFVYDADSFTTITMGDWTITAASAEQTNDGDWLLSGATINDYVHFLGNTLLSGNWQAGNLDALTLDPDGEAYIAFDPDSDDFLVRAIFLDEGDDLILGSWDTFTLEPDGEDGVPFSARQTLNSAVCCMSLSVIELPYDTGTLYPDRVEVPVIDINLDLPFQKYLFFYNDMLPCSATAEAMFTADIDSIDLALNAEIKQDVSDDAISFMGVLGISEFGFEIDTAVRRLGLHVGVKLVGDQGFTADIAFVGLLLDTIALSIETDITVTQPPTSVTIKEISGGLYGLSNIVTGSLQGVTVKVGAVLHMGAATDVLPFLRYLDWLPADEIPPILATSGTELSLCLGPFSLVFTSQLKLFDEILIGQATMGVGQYEFEQALLDISDDEAIGFYADVQAGPVIDFSVIRIEYHAGPRLDINNHGIFMELSGTAGFGINLGFVEFTTDLVGTFLVAMHGVNGSPQLSIVADATSPSGIPCLWAAGSSKTIRVMVNGDGIRIEGIPSPLDAALDWLDDQIEAAMEETWDAVEEGMEALNDAANLTWDILGGGVDLAQQATGDMIDLVSDGLGVMFDTGSDVIGGIDNFIETTGQQVGGITGQLADYGGQIASEFGNHLEQGYSGFVSTVSGVGELFSDDDDEDEEEEPWWHVW